MPVAGSSNDSKFVIGAAISLAVFTALGVFAGPQQERFPPYSSYSSRRDGVRAAYLLLSELGYQVERWDGQLSDLPPEPGVLLVVAEPSIPGSKLGRQAEREALQSFLSKGGRVLLTGAEARRLLPDVFNEYNVLTAGKIPAVVPSTLTWRAPEIELGTVPAWPEKGTHPMAHYASERGAAVVSYAVGQGEVIWWADSGILTNAGLPKASNVQLLLNSVGPREGGRILWDEHFHGSRRSALAYFGGTPAKWLVLQFVALFAAALITFGRRHGSLLVLKPAGSRLSPLEFVETIGDLYQRKRAAPEALESAFHRFRFLLLRRLGLSPTATAQAAAAAAAERWTYRNPAFLEMLTRCESALRVHDVTERDALRLIGEMHRYTLHWRLSEKARGE